MTFLAQILERLTAQSVAGRACSRVDVSPDGMALIAQETVVIPVRNGLRMLIPGVYADVFIDRTLGADEVRLARPTHPDV